MMAIFSKKFYIGLCDFSAYNNDFVNSPPEIQH